MGEIVKSTRDLQVEINKMKTGKVCNKHSLKIRQGRYTSKEVVPFDEKLGVYPVDYIKGRTEEFCPECRKLELIDPVVKEWQEQATRKNSVKDSSNLLKTKSVVIDPTIKEATFSNFKIIDDGTKRLKHEAFQMAQEILNGATNNFLLCGNFGTGKSHLAMSIASYVNVESYKLAQTDEERKPFRVIFLSVSEMLNKIYHSYSLPYLEKVNYRHTEEEYKKIMQTYDLVVLDDLGAELGRLNGKGATDNMVKLLSSFLELRMSKPTVITSNFTLEQIDKNYDGRLDSRVKSGLKGNILVFNDTTDKRGGV